MARFVPVLYLAVMIAVIVGGDLAFFRSHIWPRLLTNMGIVLLFGALYLRFVAKAG